MGMVYRRSSPCVEITPGKHPHVGHTSAAGVTNMVVIIRMSWAGDHAPAPMSGDRHRAVVA